MDQKRVFFPPIPCGLKNNKSETSNAFDKTPKRYTSRKVRTAVGPTEKPSRARKRMKCEQAQGASSTMAMVDCRRDITREKWDVKLLLITRIQC